MEKNTVTAKLNNLRISPRKVQLVVREIAGKDAATAKRILRFAEKRSAKPLLKLLDSAVSNAKNRDMDGSKLKVKEVLLGSGATLKRGRFVSRGSYHRIMKRTSNIKMTLTFEVESGEKEEKNGK